MHVVWLTGPACSVKALVVTSVVSTEVAAFDGCTFDYLEVTNTKRAGQVRKYWLDLPFPLGIFGENFA